MSMDSTQLSSEIAAGLSQADTTETLAFAKAVVEELQASAVASTGSPSGTISSIDANSMSALIVTYASYPYNTTEVQGFCDALKSHIESDAVVTYPADPWSAGGIISNLSGATMADLWKTNASYPSVTAQILGFCDAVVDHIMTNASCDGGALT